MFFFKKTNIHIRKIFPVFLSLFLIISFLGSDSFTTYAQTNVFTQNVYHAHTGGSGYGCYTRRYEYTEYIEVPCPGQMVYFADADKSQCSYCGAGYYGDQSYRDCYYSTTKEEKHVGYDLGCGMSTSSVMGSFSVTKSTEEWTKELYLNMSLEPVNITSDATSPFNVNGNGIDGYEYKVTECGDYKVSLKTATGYSSSPVDVPVKNIDTTGPSLINYSISPTEWTADSVTVTLTGVEDLQPDGTPGCGLADSPYSYDNGDTWTSQNSNTYYSNGEHTVLLKDKLDNISSCTVKVSNLDKEPPRIISIDYDKTPYVKNVTLEVTADDIMSDGREGVGLHEQAYSYDNGDTWTDDNTLFVEECCIITVSVRDKLGNVQVQDVEVDNIDCYGPIVSHSLFPSWSTLGPVSVFINAEDVGYNGSPGIGLPEEYLSYDGGKNWTSRCKFDVESNRSITILAKDKNENISTYVVKVDNIRTDSDDDDDDDDDIITPVVTPKPTPTPVPTKPVPPPTTKPKIKKDVTPTVTPKPVKPDKSKVTPAPTKQTIPIKQRADSDSNNTTDISSVNDTSSNDFTLADLFLLILFTLIILLLLFLLLFLLSRMVRIYNITDKNHKQFKGICFIHYSKDQYEINIDKSVIEACSTNTISARFSRLFIMLHKDDDVAIYVSDKQNQISKPTRNVIIVLKM